MRSLLSADTITTSEQSIRIAAGTVSLLKVADLVRMAEAVKPKA
jgi:hypothetical protein